MLRAMSSEGAEVFIARWECAALRTAVGKLHHKMLLQVKQLALVIADFHRGKLCALRLALPVKAQPLLGRKGIKTGPSARERDLPVPVLALLRYGLFLLNCRYQCSNVGDLRLVVSCLTQSGAVIRLPK